MNFRIGQKLAAIVGMLALLAAGLSAFAFWQSRLQQRQAAEIESIWDFALQTRILAQSVEHVVVVADSAFASDDSQEVKSKLAGLRKALDQLQGAIGDFNAHSGDNIPEATKTTLGLRLKDFISYQNDTVQLGLTVSPKAALIQANDDDTVKNREKMIADIGTLTQSALDRLASERSANATKQQKIEAFMVGVPAVVIAIGVLIAAWVFASSNSSPAQDDHRRHAARRRRRVGDGHSLRRQARRDRRTGAGPGHLQGRSARQSAPCRRGRERTPLQARGATPRGGGSRAGRHQRRARRRRGVESAPGSPSSPPKT